MIELLKKIPGVIYCVRVLRGFLGVSSEKLNLDHHRKRRSAMIKKYTDQAVTRKLQIGAQSNSIDGWLNVDINPKSDDVVYMDATEKFPFPHLSFDYVFSEHMIEHISLDQADFMLGECFSILKPGGKIRIATPDIQTISKVLSNPQAPDHKSYLESYHKRFFKETLPKDPVWVVNKLFYGFDHRFIHSITSLKYLLEKNGFTEVKGFEVGQSDDPELTGIEQHWREMGEIPNRVETIVVEAVKHA